MLGKLKALLISIILFCLTPYGFGQSHKMPEPGMMSATSPPPPVGLPLPIDDYLPMLFLAGIVLGAVKIRKQKMN